MPWIEPAYFRDPNRILFTSFSSHSHVGDASQTGGNRPNAAAVWPTLDRVIYCPVILELPFVLNQFAIYTGVQNASSQIDVGLFTEAGVCVTSAGLTAMAAAGVQVFNVTRTVSGAADNGSGLVRLTTGAHKFPTGATVYVTGVTGTTEANGIWTVTSVDSTHFDLQGSTFAHAYVSGGTAAYTGIPAQYYLAMVVDSTVATGTYFRATVDKVVLEACGAFVQDVSAATPLAGLAMSYAAPGSSFCPVIAAGGTII